MARNRNLISILSFVLFTGLIACNKSKNSTSEGVALAPIQASSDATVADSEDESKEIEDCEKYESDDEAEEADESLALKSDKAKGDKVQKDCPVTSTSTSAPSGTASLDAGQKLYASHCQSCHGALPGAKQGATAATILAASTVGPHKSIAPWPAGAGSTLSAQDAAASLSAAMK